MGRTRLEIVRREPFDEGRAFADTGPGERIDTVAHHAVAPAHPANAGIVDLDRAERDEGGKVRFSGDATFLIPADPARANRALLFEAPNRGNRVATLRCDHRVRRMIVPNVPPVPVTPTAARRRITESPQRPARVDHPPSSVPG